MAFSEPKQSMAFEANVKYVARIKTSKGLIVCELYPEQAPISVTNFVNLAKGGFYKGLTFHRVVADFVVQGGILRGMEQGDQALLCQQKFALSMKKGRWHGQD